VIEVRHVSGPGLIAVRAWLPGGARSETVPGQALVTGRALTEGSLGTGGGPGRDFRRIADEAEALGTSVSSNASQEIHGVSVESRHGHWREALDWAVELATRPSFPEDRCRWVARQAAAELESLGDQPEVRTAWAFLEQLYAPHPRARPIHGSRESLAGLVAADCARFHAEAAERQGGGLAVQVTGDVDPEAVRSHLEGLGVTAGEVAPVPEPPAPVGLPEPRREVSLPPGDQAHLSVGGLTVPAAHPDRHALELLGIVMGAGAGLSGRLPERVREKEGLAYSVQIQTLAGAGLDPGRLAVYVGTSPETVEQAERAVFEELARMLSDGVTAEEVADARSYLLGREPFRRESARQWADLLVQSALYGVPEHDQEWHRERIEALDPEAVAEAGRRHLEMEAMKVTVGLPG
jgi:zinc protease